MTERLPCCLLWVVAYGAMLSGSLLSPFSHILAFLCISIGFHCHILCNNISLFSPCGLPIGSCAQPAARYRDSRGGETDGYPEDQSLTHPSPSLPLLASPSYLPLVPHFPPSRGQTTTRDSVGFRISAPLLSPLLCNRGCGHIY